jgi:hypothetical protein
MEFTMQKESYAKPAIFANLFLLTMFFATAYGAELTPRAKKLLHGRTVQIDLGFDMYKDRSERSIAEEIAANGYEGVYYFVTSDKGVRKDVIDELQKRGIPVAALVCASGTYMPVEERIKDWQKYKMVFTNNTMDEYKLMTYVNKDYLGWMKNRIVTLINKNGFDGFTFAEVMFPIGDGLEREKVLYGDISPEFQAAFKEATGNTIFPEFVNKNKPNYYKNVPKVYSDLVEFRVKVINDFYAEVINGNDGVREKCPGVFVASWSQGASFSDCLSKIREWEGNDASAMMKRVRSDMHFIQTHWMDWSNPDINGDYPLLYKPFFDAIKNADGNVPIGLQADFVSQEGARRSLDYQKLFYKTCEQMGVSSTTYYEFSQRWAVYMEPAQLCKASLVAKDTVELCFDKRISKNCNRVVLGRKMIVADNGKNYTVKSSEVDGNLLKVVLDGNLTGVKEVKVNIGGIKDDPSYRWAPKGKVNVVPADTVKELTLQS